MCGSIQNATIRMRPYCITKTTGMATMAPSELAEKSTDINMLRETIELVAQHLMDLDVETFCDASYGQLTA